MLTGKQKFDRGRRLLTAQDFTQVFNEPFRSTDQYFTCLARSNDQSQPRLGLAISKKNTRRAVDRNRLKRLIRESFRQNQSDLGKIDVVIMAKRQAAQQTNELLYRSLSEHWNNFRHKFSTTVRR